MQYVLLALAILAAGGVLAALLSRWPVAASVAGAGTCVLAAAVGLPAVLFALTWAPNEAAGLSHPWNIVPGAELSVRLDVLSALFFLPVFFVSAVVAVFSAGYFLSAGERPIGMIWLWFNLLVAGMGLTLVASNAVLFLVAWEVMSLAAWFLIVLDDFSIVRSAGVSSVAPLPRRAGSAVGKQVQRAGWIWLVSAHLGAAFLVALFALLGHSAGTLELAAVNLAKLSSTSRDVLFLLALIGFGTKAGVWPLHVWVSETYAAAPGPIPALLSGVMSKLGLYGLLRMLSLLGAPPAWWAWLLIGLGAVGAVFGILQALGQQDLKRILAGSSIENVGIILLGLGVGLLGLNMEKPAVALLGFGGAVFHILNHSLCKSLLFLGSAAIEQGAGTVEVDRLGGLMRRLPVLGCAFLVGAAAISGLPPLNSFASELLIYLGAFEQTTLLGPVDAILPLVVIATLALVGGLAVACFSRVFAVVFLGTPRTEDRGSKGPAAAAPRTTEGDKHPRFSILDPRSSILTLPLALLAGACVVVGFAAPAVADRLVPVLSLLSSISYADTEAVFLDQSKPLFNVVVVLGVFVALLAGLVLLRWLLLRHREVTQSDTWGCGYTRPTPRIQYTASSYAGPLLETFGRLLGLKRRKPVITRYFPSAEKEEPVDATVDDPVLTAGYRPIFCNVASVLGWLHFLQAGRVQIYVLYIVLTLLVLLVATLGAS
jgi:formate hydrogenlyase subunit 3/multisubunit Na+/H+ antiporter MnhD subunit